MGPISKPSSASARRKKSDTTTSSPSHQYRARRSNISQGNTAAVVIATDGIIWKERLAVVEGVTKEGNPRLYIRSYFRNPITHERVWDEPPSGAGGVDFASPELRKHAETQKKELQFTLDLIPPDQSSSLDSNDHKNNDKPTKRTNLLGRLITKKKEKTTLRDDSKDLNLQRAIARSMQDQHGGGSGNAVHDDPRILYDSEFSDAARMSMTSAPSSSLSQPFHHRSSSQEEDDLAMAKALSLSENTSTAAVAASSESIAPGGMTEDEMMKWAMEQSQLEAYGLPAGSASSSSSSSSSPHSAQQQQPTVPMQRACTPPSSSLSLDETLLHAFDPYSPLATTTTVTTSCSTTPTPASADDAHQHIHKIDQDSVLDMDRKHPARSLSRKMFGTRKRMEAQAGVL